MNLVTADVSPLHWLSRKSNPTDVGCYEFKELVARFFAAQTACLTISPPNRT